jgi:hypothetical protein
MAQERIASGGEYGGRPLAMSSEESVPDGVDPGVHPVQAAVSDSLVDCASAPPSIQQLPPPHDAVLPPSKLGKFPIVIASP